MLAVKVPAYNSKDIAQANTQDLHSRRSSRQQNFKFSFLVHSNFIMFVISSNAQTTLNCLEDSMQIIVFKFHMKLPRWYSVDKSF
jgi:hypothetical protein